MGSTTGQPSHRRLPRLERGSTFSVQIPSRLTHNQFLSRGASIGMEGYVIYALQFVFSNNKKLTSRHSLKPPLFPLLINSTLVI